MGARQSVACLPRYDRRSNVSRPLVIGQGHGVIDAKSTHACSAITIDVNSVVSLFSTKVSQRHRFQERFDDDVR